MEVKRDFKNDLMKRREVKVMIEAEKNPSYADAAKIIAEHFKAPEENILVEGVKGRFGSNIFMIDVSIYDTKELMEEAKKRQTKVKKKAGEAAPTTEKK